MTEVEVWVVVDDNGNVALGTDSDAAQEQAGENDLGMIRRVVCVNIKLPTPEAIAVDVELPAESSECKVTVAE